MKVSRLIYVIPLILCISCKSNLEPKLKTTNSEVSHWFHKDFQLDSVPGIGLNRVYNELLNDNEGEEIVIAILDTQVDITHEDLKNQIYINKKEVPNNGLDDDANGYIDDIHGWNFLGYDKDSSIQNANYESVRIIRRLAHKFKDINQNFVDEVDHKEFKKYQKAIELRDKKFKANLAEIKRAEWHITTLKNSKAAFNNIFPNMEYTLEKVEAIVPKNEEEESYKKFLRNYVRFGFTPQRIEGMMTTALANKQKVLNLKFNERELINANTDNNNYQGKYGNNRIWNPVYGFTHGTQVSGIIAATRKNELGIQGISNKIKLMILPVIANGDEYDDDIANAIRYAVDNGARVINMSSGKEISDNPEIIQEALKYADEHDVLFVTSSGNAGLNIDLKENTYYPIDYNSEDKEIVSNFICVGSTNEEFGENLVSNFSNYGKRNVDIFAPGGMLMEVANTGQIKYTLARGTSLSCALVSGVAGLLFSKHPELKAKEIKQIIMESGSVYKENIKIGDTLLPFSELSKSGKLLNAFEALKMAHENSNKN